MTNGPTADQGEFFTRYAELAEHLSRASYWSDMKPEDCNPAATYSAEEIIAGWRKSSWRDVAKDATLLAAAAVRLADAAAEAETTARVEAGRQRIIDEALSWDVRFWPGRTRLKLRFVTRVANLRTGAGRC